MTSRNYDLSPSDRKQLGTRLAHDNASCHDSHPQFPLSTPRTMTNLLLIKTKRHAFYLMGPLHDPVTWYKITYTGEQIAQWDFQNNAPAFVLEVPLCNLLTSIYNFVPCDRVVQRAYYSGFPTEARVINFLEVFCSLLLKEAPVAGLVWPSG